MRKLSLLEWAALAEIVGTAAVVVSLLIVSASVERNTAVATIQTSDDLYEAVRELNLNLIDNPDLLRITMRATSDPGSLTPEDREIYRTWLHVNLDLWQRTRDWAASDLVYEQELQGWDDYFGEWTRRHMTPDQWNDIRWRFADPEFRDYVEALLVR